MQEGFYVCVHPEHNSVMEIFDEAEFKEIEQIDDQYEVVLVTASKAAAIEFVKEAIEAALKMDPQLQHLKEDIRELYL